MEMKLIEEDNGVRKWPLFLNVKLCACLICVLVIMKTELSNFKALYIYRPTRHRSNG